MRGPASATSLATIQASMPDESSIARSDSSIPPSRVRSTWPRVVAGRLRGVWAASCASIQGMKKNWMNVNGRITTRKTVPVRSTTIVKSRPASDANVISPKPRVDIVTNVQ